MMWVGGWWVVVVAVAVVVVVVAAAARRPVGRDDVSRHRDDAAHGPDLLRRRQALPQGRAGDWPNGCATEESHEEGGGRVGGWW